MLMLLVDAVMNESKFAQWELPAVIPLCALHSAPPTRFPCAILLATLRPLPPGGMFARSTAARRVTRFARLRSALCWDDRLLRVATLVAISSMPADLASSLRWLFGTAISCFGIISCTKWRRSIPEAGQCMNYRTAVMKSPANWSMRICS